MANRKPLSLRRTSKFLDKTLRDGSGPITSTWTTKIIGYETTVDHVESPSARHFGRYRVLRCLGRGGFGEVFLAEDDELKRLVAVKIPRPGRMAADLDADSFFREARLVARLDH